MKREKREFHGLESGSCQHHNAVDENGIARCVRCGSPKPQAAAHKKRDNSKHDQRREKRDQWQ